MYSLGQAALNSCSIEIKTLCLLKPVGYKIIIHFSLFSHTNRFLKYFLIGIFNVTKLILKNKDS